MIVNMRQPNKCIYLPNRYHVQHETLCTLGIILKNDREASIVLYYLRTSVRSKEFKIEIEILTINNAIVLYVFFFVFPSTKLNRQIIK